MDDTTLFRVVLHLLVVFTEQLFAALVSSGGNSRLPLAALNNRDFVVWTGHFVSLLSVIGGWGGVLPPHFGRKKAGDLFQISCSVCRCVSGGYLVVKVRDKLTRCVSGKLEVLTLINTPTSLTSILHLHTVQATMTKCILRSPPMHRRRFLANGNYF